MCVKQWFLLFVLCCSQAASLHSEQWFQISGTELARLETISQNWETDRQSLLSQVSGLKQTADRLQLDSKALNDQLKAERNTRQTLQKSFEQSETDRLSLLSKFETTISALKDDVAKQKINALKAQNQRNLLFFISIGATGVIVLSVLSRLKKMFG